jgi:hypothetical protein
MSKHLNTLLVRDMTRKEFLATLGFGLVSILGFSNLIHLLTGKPINKYIDSASKSKNGYGSSSYGH